MKVAQMELKMTLMGHKLSRCNNFSQETVGNVWRDFWLLGLWGGFENTISIQRVKVRDVATYPVMPMTSPKEFSGPKC